MRGQWSGLRKQKRLRNRHALRYWEMEKAGMERTRIDLMSEQNGIEFYRGRYARQFRFDQ